MPITPQEALQRTIEHREIFHDEMLHLMRMIMKGELSPVMTASIITGLRVKKETIGEISAAAEVMREFSNKVNVADRTNLVDIVGTGGDGANTFNISTCSIFVIAAAGGKVSKHGGRSVSSKSGSADAMEALGAQRSNITAVIGPTISQAAYEVGPEFFDRFRAEDEASTRYFANGEGDRMLFDLPGYGLYRLRNAGVKQAEWTGHCTYRDPARFYSFRRTTHAAEADYGRLISTIRL